MSFAASLSFYGPSAESTVSAQMESGFEPTADDPLEAPAGQGDACAALLA
ncbi:MAG: hypothetical protein AAF907_00860 [Planctomycetota bacterium]